MSFAKEIWTTLSRVDVSERIEKKGNLSYLSWAWAWGVLMENYPESQFFFEDNQVFPDESVEVRVVVTVNEGEKTFTRTMWLPVMDNRNHAIIGPNARDISDAKMRCLVKCLALFGLGHYIFAGEDTPSPAIESKISDEKVEWANQVLADTEANHAAFQAWLTAKTGVGMLGDVPESKWVIVEEALLNRLNKYCEEYAKGEAQ